MLFLTTEEADGAGKVEERDCLTAGGEPLLWTAQVEGTAEFFSILRVRLVDSVEIVSAEVITPLEQFYPRALTSLINDGHGRSYLFNQHVYRLSSSRVVDMMFYHHNHIHELFISLLVNDK